MINQAQDTVMGIKATGLGQATTQVAAPGHQAAGQMNSQMNGQAVGQSTSQVSGQAVSQATSQAPVQATGSVSHSNAGSAANSVNSKTKIIKRYQNRKLYDTQQSCYVTLDDIAKMIRTNEDVMVIDNKTKNDITAATLTQIIFEAEKKASQYAPLFTLREIIQNANGSISSYLAKLGAFPKDYAKAEPVAAVLGTEKASFDDMKQTLENRVAKAATDQTDLNAGNKFIDDQTPSLPNSNKSLNQ
jgi:polyhydroxyalkanoate synthesis repressor PhaR